MQFKDFLRPKQLMMLESLGGIGVPVFVSAEVGAVADNKLTMTYSEDMNSTIVPATIDYDVNDGAANAATNVAINGPVITLTLTNVVNIGDTVVVGYTAGVNKLQDLDGVIAENLTTESVTNNSSTP